MQSIKGVFTHYDMHKLPFDEMLCNIYRSIEQIEDET